MRLNAIIENITKAAPALHQEFVDLTDMRVGTTREIQDCGASHEEATAIHALLDGAYREFKSLSNPEIETEDGKARLLALCDTCPIPKEAIV